MRVASASAIACFLKRFCATATIVGLSSASEVSVALAAIPLLLRSSARRSTATVTKAV